MNVMIWLLQPGQIPPPDGPERVALLARRPVGNRTVSGPVVLRR